jgi:ubiquinone biosynthesis protein
VNVDATYDEPGADWNDFLEALDFGALVPAAYARYRPAVVDGLIFFLENLSADRALELLDEQLSMPEGTAVEQRLVAIARRCPALHKLGQVLARDRRLPPEFRRLLQHLESMASPLNTAQAQRMVEAELGPLDRVGIRIEEPPLAEASVAVVIPFTGCGRGLSGARGVCKMLKPGIEAKLEEELELLQRIGALLDARCDAYDLPPIAYEETFVQVRSLLAQEVCLSQEQQHLADARETYLGMDTVVIPTVFGFSTPRLTAMQRVDGIKVTDAAALSAKARRKLGDLLVRALVARPLWSDAPLSLFHADPHAGNLFVTPDSKLAILDWSLIGELGKSDRVSLTQILLGALTLDAVRIKTAIYQLAQHADATPLSDLVDRYVGRLRDGAWPGMSWLMALMDEAVTAARCRFGGELVMFRKVLQTLDGVVSDVSEDCHPDRVLMLALLRRLAAEWGERTLSLPFSRHFSTNFSNLDLAQLMLSAPLIGSRQWMGLQSDLLRSPHLRLRLRFGSA